MQTFYLETLLNNENLSLFYKNEFQNPPSHLRKVSIKQNFALYSGDLFDMIKIILREFSQCYHLAYYEKGYCHCAKTYHLMLQATWCAIGLSRHYL